MMPLFFLEVPVVLLDFLVLLTDLEGLDFFLQVARPLVCFFVVVLAFFEAGSAEEGLLFDFPSTLGFPRVLGQALPDTDAVRLVATAILQEFSGLGDFVPVDERVLAIDEDGFAWIFPFFTVAALVLDAVLAAVLD